MHPYLVRQMSDSRLRRPKKGLNSRAHADNSTSLAYQPATLMALLNEWERKETQ